MIKFYTNFVVLILLQYLSCLGLNACDPPWRSRRWQSYAWFGIASTSSWSSCSESCQGWYSHVTLQLPPPLTIGWQVRWEGDSHFDHFNLWVWESKIPGDFIFCCPPPLVWLDKFLIGCIAVQCIVSYVSVNVC